MVCEALYDSVMKELLDTIGERKNQWMVWCVWVCQCMSDCMSVCWCVYVCQGVLSVHGCVSVWVRQCRCMSGCFVSVWVCQGILSVCGCVKVFCQGVGVSMYVRLYVVCGCVSVCMSGCFVSVWVCRCISECMSVWVCQCMYVRVFCQCVGVSVYLRVYVSVWVCQCMYVRVFCQSVGVSGCSVNVWVWWRWGGGGHWLDW